MNYAYVIDLDENILETFKGFNKSPLTKGERFYKADSDWNNHKYHPVRSVAKYNLSKLPTVKEMEKDYIKEKE